MKHLSPDAVKETALQLTLYLLELSFSSWVYVEKVDKMLKKFDIHTLEERIYFLTALTVFIRNRMPDNTFLKPESKETLLKAIQDKLDQCIIEENS